MVRNRRAKSPNKNSAPAGRKFGAGKAPPKRNEKLSKPNSHKTANHKSAPKKAPQKTSIEKSQIKDWPSANAAQNQPRYQRPAPKGARLRERLPIILETNASSDYALLDSGNGLKLEQYGQYRIVRPEAQALWQPCLSKKQWEDVDAVFTGDVEEEGLGRWHFPKEQLPPTWPMKFDGLDFFGRFTSFRHTGVFPEQASHWHFMQDTIGAKCARDPNAEPPRMLNLFGYTGVASLVAARAGAHVTHVDASKKAIGWARENQELAGLDDAPIRWICDDAMKFCAREIRRGKKYDAIILDPPAFGRGPNGEVWQLFDHLCEQLDMVRELISDRPLFVTLTAYAIRTSFFAMHELMQECFAGLEGELQSGELILREENAPRQLSTSMFSRWLSDETLTLQKGE
jgi:23S rRNA (cytosine1962-C5)-methyltransferase